MSPTGPSLSTGKCSLSRLSRSRRHRSHKGAAMRRKQQMALYKNVNYLTSSNDAAFDKTYKPGKKPDHSGIFRCTGCGREVISEHSRTVPPQNHHQHDTSQGEVRWKLIVWPDHNPK